MKTVCYWSMYGIADAFYQYCNLQDALTVNRNLVFATCHGTHMNTTSSVPR